MCLYTWVKDFQQYYQKQSYQEYIHTNIISHSLVLHKLLIDISCKL